MIDFTTPDVGGYHRCQQCHSRVEFTRWSEVLKKLLCALCLAKVIR